MVPVATPRGDDRRITVQSPALAGATGAWWRAASPDETSDRASIGGAGGSSMTRMSFRHQRLQRRNDAQRQHRRTMPAKNR